ncbi:MAG TPA: M56 family metallopeptidase [Candidatus Limnocylindrales bacterium]|nr:M56 family metallopeptidase [Candidatus Limnocylindrales bacterium]
MDALLLAVLNALWQGAAVIALVALALRAGLRRNATTACVVWSVAFVLVAVLPLIDLALAHPHPAPVAQARETYRIRIADDAPAAAAARVRAARAATATRPSAASMDVGFLQGPREISLAQRFDEIATRAGGLATAFAHSWGIALVGLWMLVAGVLLLRLIAAYAAVARMKRGATPIDDAVVTARLRAAGHRRRATIASSPIVQIPCAVGFRRPMILVPQRLVDSLDADDLARVVLHESAHLQRYDDWTNALEQLVCAVQFFQPALYVARRGIDFEREVACDDRVLEDAGEPIRYAECLARIVQRHVRGAHAVVVPGFVLRRAQVVARVRRIVDRSRDASPQLRTGAAVVTALVLLATFGIARLQVPLVAPAEAQSSEAAPPPKAVRATNAAPLAHVAKTVKAAKPVSVAPIAKKPGAVVKTAPIAKSAPVANVVATTTAVAEAQGEAVSVDVHVAPVAPIAVKADSHRVAPAAAAAAAASTHVVIAPIPVRALVRTAVSTTSAAVRSSTVVASSSGDGLLDAIDEAKYPRPTVDELIALKDQGITGDYVRRMGALGRARPPLNQLVALAVQGITPDYILALDHRLADRPAFNEIIGLRVQGVSAAWLDGLASIGYPRLKASDAVSLAVQGVSVSYVRELMEAGLRNVTPAQLVALRVQSVDGAFVRHLVQHGYKNLTPDELIRLKVSGLQP